MMRIELADLWRYSEDLCKYRNKLGSLPADSWGVFGVSEAVPIILVQQDKDGVLRISFAG